MLQEMVYACISQETEVVQNVLFNFILEFLQRTNSILGTV